MSEEATPEVVKTSVAALVREARRAHGLTQQELATRVSITVQAVSAIENGRALPSLTSVLALSHVLGVPIAATLEAGAGTNEGLQIDTAKALNAIARMDTKSRAVATKMLEALAEAYPATHDTYEN